MIPRILHQTWKTHDIPAHLRFFAQTWRKHHPDWEYRLWSDEDNRAFIAQHYPGFLPYYDRYRTPICRVDAVRIFMLKHYGGVYADLDFECLTPFDPLLDTDAALFGEEPDSHTAEHRREHPDLTHIVCNALMASPPGHPFWDHVIECMINAHHEPGPLNATGPFLLTRALASWRGEAPVSVLPSSALYPLANVDGSSGRSFDLGFWHERTRNAYAVHHWAGSWWRDRPEDTGFPSDSARVRLSDCGQPLADAHVLMRGRPPFGADAPLVSCLMITRNRATRARLAVECFLRQDYPARELVILDDGEDDGLREHVATLADPRIRIFRPDGERATLGQLRNRAVGLARGTYVCQWDDDDLYDPARIASQMAALQTMRADACFLERWTIWWPANQRLALSTRRQWEGSMLCLKSRMPAYPSLARGEDTPVAEHIAATCRIALLDQPRLYLYVAHAANTFDDRHFDRHWDAATLRFEGENYARMSQELSKRLALADYPVSDARPADMPNAPSSNAEATRAVADTPQPAATPSPVRAKAARRDGSTPRVLILTPIKNAARFLPRFFELASRLDHPREQLGLAFLEGDSDDGTPERLQELAAQYANAFARINVFHRSFGLRIDGERTATDVQYLRRSVIAKCRNALFRLAWRGEDRILWIDADLTDYPEDVLTQLIAADKSIVVPHCVTAPGGPTFDLNTFQLRSNSGRTPWAYMNGGIVQPPRGVGRRYLEDLRGTPLVELDGVGGTMLLVDAALHASGVLFPDYAYRGFIETEGFAMLARDRGVRAWGMPDLEILHDHDSAPATQAAPKHPLHLRPDTWDRSILDSVFAGEYGEIDLRDKTVIDIGAHIGSFSLLAATRGARRVLAFEAGRENFALLQTNCADFPCIECVHGAVWNSDDADTPLQWRPNAVRENSGGGTVVSCMRVGCLNIATDHSESVGRIAFDDIVAKLGRVDLVKIDAEGSEYPILLGSRMLDRVNLIVGEYHTLRELSSPAAEHWNVTNLVRHLRGEGFIVECHDDPDNGVFRAFRPPGNTAGN